MLTILTPTYNRGYILGKAYESLCRQSCLNFEWVVVDDGSVDDTEQLVKRWMSECKQFVIRYEQQANGGKHRAVNRGVQIAKGDHILILDSDDFLTDTAVERVYEWIDSIKGREDFAGVAGLKGWMNRDGVVGDAASGDFVDATNLERLRCHLRGDKAEVYRTEILRRYPFPEFDGENFLAESASWDRIARDGYKIRWFNEIIYKCEYLEDGLSHRDEKSRYEKNYQGFVYCSKLSAELKPFPYNYLNIGHFAHVSQMLGIRKGEMKKYLGVTAVQMLLGRMVFGLNELRKEVVAGRRKEKSI